MGHLLNGEWHIQAVLGSDEMEIIYHAVGIQTGRESLVRELFPAAVAIRAGLAVRPRLDRFATRFEAARTKHLEEGQARTALEHGNISQLIDFFVENGTSYLVTAYARGETLAQRLEREPKLDPSWLDDMLGAVLEGLSAMHEKGLVHLDVRPGSIFLRAEDDIPMLWGTGAARQALLENDQEHGASEDPYLAPEQYQKSGQEPDYLTDIYSLAAVLARCVTGLDPASAMARMDAVRLGRDDPEGAFLSNEWCPDGYRPGFLRAIGAGMAIDRENRPRSLLDWNEHLFWDESGSEHRFGRLWIEFIPENATAVIADGSPYEPGMRLALGECTVQVEAPYHQPREVRIEIKQGTNQEQISLSQYGGKLWVDTDPPGAGLRLNGAVFHSGEQVVLGDHVLQAGAVGYLPQSIELQIRDAETRLTVELERRSASTIASRMSAVLIRPASKNDADRVHTLLQAKVQVDAQDHDGRTALMAAAEKDHLAVIKVLLEGGAQANTTDYDGASALMHAAAADNNAAMLELLGAGADVNVQNWNEATALLLAATAGHTEVVRTLLRASADSNLQAKNGDTALIAAARGGYKKIVDGLLAGGAHVDAATGVGTTALMEAARGGHAGTVRALLTAGADAGSADADGLTALHAAASGGHGEVITQLLESGVDVNTATKDGRTALQLALDSGHSEAVRPLAVAASVVVKAIRNGANADRVRDLLAKGYAVNAVNELGQTALMVASSRGDPEIVAILLAAGADMECCDQEGKTALEYALATNKADIVRMLRAEERMLEAAGNGDIDLLRALVEIGVDVNVQDADGMTALMLASANGYEKVVDLLLAAGTDFSLRNTSGQTAMQLAVTAHHAKVIQLLNNIASQLLKVAARGEVERLEEMLRTGFEINGADNNGDTALIAASRAGNLASVEMLLKAGAEIETKGRDSQTALLAACATAQPEVVNRLLEAGASVEAKDDIGRSALLLACEQGTTPIVRALLQAGVDVNASDDFEHTAIMAACRAGATDVIEILAQSGGDANVRDHDGQTTLLIAAAEHENPAVVQAVLDAGGDINARDKAGRTALMSAGAQGHAGVVAALIAADARLELEDHGGRTALMYAIDSGSKDTVRHLMREIRAAKIQKTAGLRKKDEMGQTARKIAKASGQQDVVRYLTWQTALHRLPLIVIGLVVVIAMAVWFVSPSAEEKLLQAVAENRFGKVRSLLSQGKMLSALFKSEVQNLEERNLDNQTALLAAANLGRDRMIELLLRTGADLEARDGLGRPALSVATIAGQRIAVSTLLDAGADVNARDNAGRTALMHAIRNGSIEITSDLLQAGADTEATDSGERSVLRYAAETPRPELPDLLRLKGKLGPASAAGDEERVRLILAVGTDIDSREQGGETALIRAAAAGHLGLVQLLLGGGADYRLTDSGGRTALAWALENGHAEIARALQEADAGIVRAILGGADPDQIRVLIEAGVPIDARDGDGTTALLAAIGNARDDLLTILLQDGADPNLADINGRPPLLAAIAADRAQAVDTLLRAGADSEKPGSDGVSPLTAAITEGSPEVVSALLQAGVNLQRRDSAGHTYLYRAAELGKTAIVSLLLAAGAEVDADGNGLGEQAIIVAVRNFFPETVAAIARLSKVGKEALILATNLGYWDAADAIMGAGASQLWIDTSPQDALVTLEGTAALAYNPGMRLPTDIYSVRVSAEHHHSQLVSLQLREGENRRAVRLQLSAGQLHVETRPTDALLHLNDEPFQSGDWVPFGEYRLRVTAYGFYRPAVRNVQVRGANERLSIRLLENLQAGENFRDCAECPLLILIPTGQFQMGSPAGEPGRTEAEDPPHRVRIAYKIAAGKFEVSFAEWMACVADNGCGGYIPNDRGWGTGQQPVINVSWNDTQEYIRWLSRKTGQLYRLPSEAEWEYITRAGTNTAYHGGASISTGQANFNGRVDASGAWRERTIAVGSLPANAFGLHDLHGNAMEWTQDCWRFNYEGAPGDGRAWDRGGECSFRVMRGGSWNDGPTKLRSAARARNDPVSRDHSFGFRVVREINN